VQLKGSDSGLELDQDGQEIQTRAISENDFKAIIENHIRASTKSSGQEMVQEE
jgi:hypothetical protein